MKAVGVTVAVAILLFALLIVPVRPVEAASMTFTSDTTISTNQVIEAGEIWTVNAGVTLTIKSGVEINNLEGTINNNGAIVNHARIIWNFGTVNNNGRITNDGYVANYANLDNYGTIANNGGTISNERGLLTNHGTIDNNNGGTVIILTGTLLNYGTLNNNDAIINNHFAILNKPTGTINNNGTINNYDIFNTDPMSITNNFGTFNNYYNVNNFGTINNYGTFNHYYGNSIGNYGPFNNHCGATFIGGGGLDGDEPIVSIPCLGENSLSADDGVIGLGDTVKLIQKLDTASGATGTLLSLTVLEADGDTCAANDLPLPIPASGIVTKEYPTDFSVVVATGDGTCDTMDIGIYTAESQVDVGADHIVSGIVEFETNFFVIPESPIGLAALMISALAALTGFAYFRKSGNKDVS